MIEISSSDKYKNLKSKLEALFIKRFNDNTLESSWCDFKKSPSPSPTPGSPPRLMLQLILSVLITSDEAYGTKTRPACELTPRQTKWNATIGLMQGQQPCLNCISPETHWTSEAINATARKERRMENCQTDGGKVSRKEMERQRGIKVPVKLKEQKYIYLWQTERNLKKIRK